MFEEEKNTNIFKEKSFTILLGVFYIFSIISVFYNLQKFFIFLIFLIISLLLIFFNYSRRRLCVLFLVFIFGVLRVGYDFNKIQNNPQDLLKDLNAKNAMLQGQIVSSKQITNQNSRIKFFLKTNQAQIEDKIFDKTDSLVLVNLNYDKSQEDYFKKITIGDYIKVQGTLKPASDSTNPYQFNYKNYLLNKDCTNILYSNDSNNLKLYKTPKFGKNLNDSWFFVLKQFEITRNKIIEKHAQNIKSPKLEILAGLVFGNETINPDDKVKEDFKNSGLLHLLAASGLNVALIYGIWWFIASSLRFPYNFSIFIGAFFVVLYTFMTGFPPSILRASIMLLFVLFGKLIDRKTSSIALIFFVGFLILLFQPKMFFDIGFQLSFMVTLGLVICCPVISDKFKVLDKKFKEKFKNEPALKRYFLNLFSIDNLVCAISVPLVAQLWVIPLQLHYFNNIAPLSVFANIAVVPFIGMLSFIGFVSSILALIPKISNAIVYIFDLIANPLLVLLLKISEFFASFKYSLISTSSFNIFQVFMFWGLILILTLNIKSFSKKYLKIFILMLFVFLLSFVKIDSFKNNLEIIAFDVRNADSFLIKTPNKKYIVIDAGKKGYRGLDDAQMIINPYLRNERIRKIDYLIITHFDLDHCGGALTLLKNFKVENIIIQNKIAKSKASFEILDYLNKNKLNYKVVKNDEIILKENNLEIRTLAPISNKSGSKLSKEEENETSIVTLLKFYDKTALFMGDSGVEGFSSIEEFIPDKINILKIGHHGAKNTINEKMLQKLKPDYSIISTGLNYYNHPDFETIDILQKNDINTMMTKNLGFIKFIITKDKILPYHYNSVEKTLLPVSKQEIPFNKSKYFENFLKKIK